MRLRVRHETRYAYAAPLGGGLLQLRLTPRAGPLQAVEDWSLEVEGAEDGPAYADANATLVRTAVPRRGAREIRVVAGGVVVTRDAAGVAGAHEGPAPLWLYRRQTPLTAPGPGIAALAGLARPGTPAALHALSAAILAAMPWTPGATGSATRAEEALAAGRGVCQDHAQVFCGAARAAGLPARYVSGYLRMDGRVRQEAAHAWAEAHLPGLGWTGFDVSNGVSPDARYVRLAAGLDYRDCAPVTGLVRGGGAETLHVALDVEEIPGTPAPGARCPGPSPQARPGRDP